MQIRATIKDILRKALQAEGFEVDELSLEHPAETDHGDYATSVALRLGNKEDRNPRDLAEALADAIDTDNHGWLREVAVAGPGFINFHLSAEFFADAIEEILHQQDDYGASDVGAGETVVVEYSSPNIAKPFTVGHLRSTIIGDAVANLLSFAGHEVIRDNHLGDWGTQYGKLVVAIREWGDIERIKKSDEPIQELVDLYVKFHDEAKEDDALEARARAAFKELEAGEEEARELWQVCKDLSLEAFENTYETLDVSFDTIRGESFFADKTDAVIEKAKKAGVAKESEGALLIFFEDNENLPPLMIQKQDGSTLYATRDLATDMYRKEEYGDDITIINEVGSEQELYFRQLFAAEEMLGIFEKSQRVHLKHGLFRFKEGKMSTREGNVVWLSDLLDEARERAAKFNPDVVEEVAIGAIKYNDLKRDAKKNITFDWDEVLNLEGNSGPYLQYTYARTQSVLKKAREAGKEPAVDIPSEVTLLERYLYRFPEVTQKAAREYAPHYLCTYLFELAQEFNAYYANMPIIDSDEAEYRLALSAAVGQVLEGGLDLLGIETVEEM